MENVEYRYIQYHYIFLYIEGNNIKKDIGKRLYYPVYKKYMSWYVQTKKKEKNEKRNNNLYL